MPGLLLYGIPICAWTRRELLLLRHPDPDGCFIPVVLAYSKSGSIHSCLSILAEICMVLRPFIEIKNIDLERNNNFQKLYGLRKLHVRSSTLINCYF